MYAGNENGNKAMTERPLFRYLFSAVVLTLIFFFAVRFMDKLYDDAAQFKFELLSNRMASSVSFVHQSWVSRGQPTRMRLNFRVDQENTRRLVVYVNRYGWPLNVEGDSRELNCSNLWRYLAEDFSEELEQEARSEIRIRTVDAGCEFQRLVSTGQTHTITYDVNLGKVQTIGN